MIKNKTPSTIQMIIAGLSAFISTTLYGEYIISRETNMISLYCGSLAEVFILFYAFRMAYLFLTNNKN